MKKFNIIIAIVLLLITTNIGAQPFTDINAGLMGLYVGSAAWGDYDNDGDLDILNNGYDGLNVYSIVYRNDSGNFININAGLAPAGYGSAVAWGDYDNDDDLDILLAGRIDNTNRITKIYRNDNGNFIDINAGLYGLSGTCAAWGDFDNDGDQDFIVTGWDGTTGNVKIYRNDDGIFNNLNAGIIGITRGTAAWGDYDNDMDLDILITGIDNNSLYNGRVYQNNNGIFTDINAGLESGQGSSAEWGDYDSDGDLDIVLTGNTSVEVHSRIYRNDNGIFVNINANIADVTESSSSWGDFDNDGDLDLLICGLNNTLHYSYIYRNNGGIFTDINAGLIGVEDRNGADWGDYDNDGDLDILLMGFDGSAYVTKIYRNDNIVSNTTPSIPINLTSSQTGNNRINLKWNKSTDAQTLQKGLTYNLRISTTPGGVEICSPMSALNTGYRRIPALGNTNHDSTWTIFNLPEGTYYWSVQAIDNSFAGSQFSPEQTFNVTITSEGNLSAGEFPNKFTLSQNFPNPFNPSTIINYQLTMFNYVSLKVFDALGKEVATLVNEKQSATGGPGTYQVEFDGSNLTSGVYFYRLTAGEFTDTKMMVLVK